jgi:hypothetical protein
MPQAAHAHDKDQQGPESWAARVAGLRTHAFSCALHSEDFAINADMNLLHLHGLIPEQQDDCQVDKCQEEEAGKMGEREVE